MLCSSAIWKINFFVTLDQTRWINEGLFYLQSYQGEVPKSQRCALNVLPTKTLTDTPTTKKEKCS